MILVGLLPVLFFLVYIFVKDKKKEPISQLLKAFVFGMATCIPAIFIELFLSDLLFGEGGAQGYFENSTEVFASIALTEEALKLLALWLVVRKNPYFDEHFDGIVYAVYVSLGFAAIENVFYLFDNMDSWISVGVMRALMSIPGHYAFGVLMGYFYSLYHFCGRRTNHKLLIFLAPYIAHGIYDSLLEPMPIIGCWGLVILLFIFYRMQRFCQKKLTEQLEKDMVAETPPPPPSSGELPSSTSSMDVPPPPPPPSLS